MLFIESTSSQAGAIKEITGSDMTHCGIVFRDGAKWRVWEGAGRGEYLTLERWVVEESGGTPAHPLYVRRLRDRDARLTPDVLARLRAAATKLHETKYDKGFAWENHQAGTAKEYVYCSELLWKAYAAAVEVELGTPHPLKDYYEQAGSAKESERIKAVMASILNSEPSRACRAGKAYDPDELAISPREVLESAELEAVTDATPSKDETTHSNNTMEKLFDPAPREFDPAAPLPTLAGIAAMKAAMPQAFAAVAAAPHGGANAVNTQLTDAEGVYGYYDASARWGRKETVDALYEVGRILARRYPGRRYGVGDISLYGGGDIDGHASHELGVDADLRLIRKDWAESATTWESSNYSREHTQEFIDLLWANSHAVVKLIFFNDEETWGTQPYPNHDDHLHIRFFPRTGPSGPPVLSRGGGNRGANGELQRCLNFWRAATGNAGAALVVDGDFGQRTFDRLREFQSATAGLGASGTADGATWGRLPRWAV